MQSVDRRTLTDVTTEALRDRILRGELSAGEPLRQVALAAELGVSRIPLREAFQRLEAEGLVSLLPHRGAVVAALPTHDMPELFSLRALIEGDTFAAAMTRVTRADVALAGRARLAFEAAVSRGDHGYLGEANLQYHLALYAPAHRPRTLDVISRLHQQCDRLLRLQLALTHGGDQAVQEHRALQMAWEAGDAAHGVQLLCTHIEGAGDRLARALATSRHEEHS
ncbi:MAG: GntR family transcriptional regulator [Gemmatimonadota bacterium]